ALPDLAFGLEHVDLGLGHEEQLAVARTGSIAVHAPRAEADVIVVREAPRGTRLRILARRAVHEIPLALRAAERDWNETSRLAVSDLLVRLLCGTRGALREAQVWRHHEERTVGA